MDIIERVARIELYDHIVLSRVQTSKLHEHVQLSSKSLVYIEVTRTIYFTINITTNQLL